MALQGPDFDIRCICEWLLTTWFYSMADRPLRSERRSTLCSETMSKKDPSLSRTSFQYPTNLTKCAQYPCQDQRIDDRQDRQTSFFALLGGEDAGAVRDKQKPVPIRFVKIPKHSEIIGGPGEGSDGWDLHTEVIRFMCVCCPLALTLPWPVSLLCLENESPLCARSKAVLRQRAVICSQGRVG